MNSQLKVTCGFCWDGVSDNKALCLFGAKVRVNSLFEHPERKCTYFQYILSFNFRFIFLCLYFIPRTAKFLEDIIS